MTRLLRTDDEIRAAARAAAAETPPLSDRQLQQLAVILAPIADQRRKRRAA